MFDFSNQVVVVTGAAGNLGQAVMHAFLEAGAKLALVDHRADRLHKLYPDLTDTPDHLLVQGIDLTDASAVEAMAAKVVAHFGQIDVLVNTAGGYRAGTPVHETPVETWDYMLNLNARSAFLASRAVVPHMLERGSGKVIHVGARAALAGSKNAAAYSAAKAALVRLTESMAAELKSHGINVNCVLPGTIDTPENREAMPNANFSRWVPPEAVADVILFLASAAARAVHGAAIPVYGES